jgi:hydrogenase expression/formation protein HypC
MLPKLIRRPHRSWRIIEYLMCLAIPGKIAALHDRHGVKMSRVDFGGVLREVCMEYVPNAMIGEYVMVHVGFAIAKVDEAEADRTYRFLLEMDQLGDIDEIP